MRFVFTDYVGKVHVVKTYPLAKGYHDVVY